MQDCIFSHHPATVCRRSFSTGSTTRSTGTWLHSCSCATTALYSERADLESGDHDLISRVHQHGIMSPMNSLNNEDYSTTRGRKHDPAAQRLGLVEHGHGSAAREAIEWRWGHERPVKYHGDMKGHPPMAPDTIYNGLWQYAPDFKNDSCGGSATAANITNQGGVLTAADGGTGTITWRMRSPYQFVGGTLSPTAVGMPSRSVSPTPRIGERPITRLHGDARV